MGSQVMSSHASKIQRRLSPYLPVSLRRYSEGSKTGIKKSAHGNLIDEERAQSTSEVFRKVAEERTGRGVGGDRNAEKAESGSEKEAVKEAYKEPPGNVISG
ncbi:uncharacterized protein LOC142543295 [Primulina tabacum]|uniref:uncharacterized protein LOC142543295 n=1 Tax=Primulina tabacum TaxID=48773 RepID=UPI003F59259E